MPAEIGGKHCRAGAGRTRKVALDRAVIIIIADAAAGEARGTDAPVDEYDIFIYLYDTHFHIKIIFR